MKILALDVGDVWTGTALSDALNITARPHQTVATENLVIFLQQLFIAERIEQIIIGYPKTMKGTKSEQTKKVEQMKYQLEQEFPQKNFLLWDERLSSKRAQELKKGHTKEEKLKLHSIAAAFILETYLQFLNLQKEYQEI